MGRARLLALVSLTICGGWSSAAGQRVIFVDAAAEGAGDGTTWADAFANLSPALALSESGDQVWVAAGKYRAGVSRADTFQLKEGVQIFGGLAGDEGLTSFFLSLRDFELNETVLEGDVGMPGSADNAFHLVTAMNVTRAAVLDGFTIANGNASGLTLMQQDVGGGLFIVDASPTIRNCLIRDNQAGSRGGAVHIAGGSPYFAHCRFVGNRTTVTQAANNLGGAVYFAGTATSIASPQFVNCLFVGNRAGIGNGGSGGAFYGGEHATAALGNCTLLHNRADTLTGGVFGSATIANCILHGNLDRNGPEPTAQLRGSILVSHSLVQGGWPGEGNINADPLFQDARGSDGLAGTVDDDARLLAGSPCIDAGNNFSWPANELSLDLDGEPRFTNDPVAVDTGQPPGAAIIDLGAYEKQSTCVNAASCNDSLFCNGEESCLNGLCRAGTAPDCADGVSCTRDLCAELERACLHQMDGSLCDNRLFCDGVEVCDGLLGCLLGTPPDCDDAIDCTIDSCDETNQLCQHTFDHVSCDDGIFCNGAELCGAAGCTIGLPPCDPGSTCDEDLDRCAAPPTACLTDADCDDANSCTDDLCLLGECERNFNELPCDDRNACTANDGCASGVCGGVLIANCGSTPTDPGPGGTNPPTDDPPSTPDPDEEPSETDANETDDHQEPPAGSPSGACPGGEPCETNPDEPAQVQDSDGDGVEDPFDLCPSTSAGRFTDAFGCEADETAGHGILSSGNSRRCGACGAMGSIGVLFIVCVPGTVLVLGRPRGHKFTRK